MPTATEKVPTTLPTAVVFNVSTLSRREKQKVTTKQYLQQEERLNRMELILKNHGRSYPLWTLVGRHSTKNKNADLAKQQQQDD